LTTEPTNGASPSPPEMLAAAAALADAVRLAKELLHRVARPEAEVPSMAPRRLPESEVASTHPFPGRKPVRPPALHPSNLSLPFSHAGRSRRTSSPPTHAPPLGPLPQTCGHADSD
jgi:hypothetical protein